MLQVIKPNTHIDFVGKRLFFIGLSILIILISLFTVLGKGGFNLGVDFTGGIVIRTQLPQKQKAEEIREALKPIKLDDSIIQEIQDRPNEYLIRVVNVKLDLNALDENDKKMLVTKFGEGVTVNDLNKLDDTTRESLTSKYLSTLDEKVRITLAAKFGEGVKIEQVEMVGPTVGKDLREKALFAILFSLLFMSVYISWRFEFKFIVSAVMAFSLFVVVLFAASFKVPVVWLNIIALIVTLFLLWALKLKYALGAIVALLHDVAVVVGAFVLTNREMSMSVVAAILTIVGYSVNDTIIVFDRIRENYRKGNRQIGFDELINVSINQTLSRTLLTSSTVLMVLVVLFLLGGTVINDFAFAMLIGVITGTYSSIYIASPIILIWEGHFFGISRVRA